MTDEGAAAQVEVESYEAEPYAVEPCEVEPDPGQAFMSVSASASAVARRGFVVGLAVAVAQVASWLPAATCESEGFTCLGAVVVTIFVAPVIACVVGLVVAALVRLQRPWLIALLGPFAAFGAVRTSVSALELGVAGLAASGALVALAYVAIALLLRPGTSTALRVAATAVVVAMIFGPGLVENELATRSSLR